jgi:anti-anti-sigma factor
VTDTGLSVELEYLQERTLVRLNGDIDLSNINDLQQRLELTADGSLNVVLDLTGVSYLDSQGLRLIKRLHERAELRGSVFATVAPAAPSRGRRSNSRTWTST